MSNTPNIPPKTPLPKSRRVPFEAMLPIENPQLLEGLDTWVKLGLISDQQVKRWARIHLQSERPIVPEIQPESKPQTIATGQFIADPESIRSVTPPRVTAPRDRSLIARILSSFMAEISVVWLLFLGVFLVVVSSAVLAASQWKNVDAIGQYGILFAYTVAFGIAALWSGRQENLRLTSRMLAATTLLIVPVNFWMMDGFRIFGSAIGLVVGLIAAAGLMVLQWRLLKEEEAGISGLMVGNLVGSSVLHLGWAIPGMALIATYVGTIGTAIVQVKSTHQSTVGVNGIDPVRQGINPSPIIQPVIIQPVVIQSVAAFGTLLLIARSTLSAGVPLSMLGLAIGICGALLCWEHRDSERQAGIWVPIGALLLTIGWFVSVSGGNLWQGLGVSALALGLLWERLHRRWEPGVVVGIIAVGLQAYTLLRVIFPPTLRSSVMAWIAKMANLNLGAWELTGLGFFLSLVGIAAFSDYLRRKDQPDLAKIAQKFALTLGFALAIPGIFNPAIRSIYFLGTFVLLLVSSTVRSKARQTRLTLADAYLTHSVGIAALLSGLEWKLGSILDRVQYGLISWTIVFLICALAEWGLLLVSRSRAVKHTAWTIGLGFAGLLYIGLFSSLMDSVANFGQLNAIDSSVSQVPPIFCLGLVLPAVLTGVARLRGRVVEQFPVSPKALSIWSTAGLGLSLLFVVSNLNLFLVCSAIATALMILNTKLIRSQWAAAITVFIGLLFTTAIIDRLAQGWRGIGIPWFGLVTLGLWVLHSLYRSKTQSVGARPSLPALYARAFDGWAIVLTTMILLIISSVEVLKWIGIDLFMFFGNMAVPIEISLVMAGIIYRTRDRLYSNWGLLGLTIAAESLVSHLFTLLRFSPNSSNTVLGGTVFFWLAIANVILMSNTQIAGDLWLKGFDRPAMIQARIDRPSVKDSAMVYIAPLFFGTIALLASHSIFTQWSGVYTIIVALVSIIVARRDSVLKLLTYIGAIGVTIGIYEIILFPLSQPTPPLTVDDAFLLLTLVGAVLAWGYRLLHRPIRKALRLEDEQVLAIAHAHFAWASTLGVLTIFAFLGPLALGSNSMGQISVNLLAGTYGLLGCYALSLGRSNAGWLTLGILQLWTGIGILLLDFLPSNVLLAWGGAIAALIAYLTAAIPWGRMGYTLINPIRNCAIALPGSVLAITVFSANIPSLLLAGGFYAWLATVSDRFRLSYVSVGLGIWAAWRLFSLWGLTDPLWYVSAVSLGIVFIVESDPTLKGHDGRETRHWMRILATALVALTAIVQSEANWSQGLLTIVLSLGLIALGLGLKTRAYLYVGTLVFMLKVLRQLWVFIGNYSLLLWALGITLGLLLIWIAATFEARRSRAIAFVQYWIGELDSWE